MRPKKLNPRYEFVPEHIKQEYLRHGISVRLPLTRHYYQMKQRCNNPNNPLYPYWGGRGIKLAISRDSFLIWFIEHYPKFKIKNPDTTASIGRIDNDKDYCKDNLILCTVSENSSELYSRRGNFSPYGTIIEDPMKYLTILTYPSVSTVAKHYNVSLETVRKLKKGETWSKFYKGIGFTVSKKGYGALWCS